MTTQEMLDELKKTQAEAIQAAIKGDKEANAKALADYDKKLEEFNARLEKMDTDAKTRGLIDNDGARHTEEGKALNSYLRFGSESNLLARPVRNAMSAGTNSDGGYMVPTPQANEIIKLATDGNPMRQLSNVINISGEYYTALVRTGKAAAAIVTEKAARPATTTPTYDEIKIYPVEMYAQPPISQILLEDAAFNVEAEVNEAVAEVFSEVENDMFFNGVGGPGNAQGILTPTFVEDSSWAWGKLGGVTAASVTSITGDELIALQDLLDDKFQAGASWLMNKKTFTALRQLKQGASGGDKYLLWNPEIIGGRLVNTLMGSPVHKCSAMSAPAAGNIGVIYGDIKRAYTIVDRVGVSIQRDPYTNKPYVNFYTRKRSGGGVKDYQAYKALKMKTV